MSRVKGAGQEALPPELKGLHERFAGAGSVFANQADVLAHSAPAFRHLYGLVEGLRDESTLSRRLVEIAVVTTSRCNECAYCVAHHGLALVEHGLDAETVNGILDDVPPGLDDTERLVRDYARLVTERAWGIRDGIFEALRERFDEREMVELTVRIGLCNLFNRFNQALQIDNEQGIEESLAASGLDASARRT